MKDKLIKYIPLALFITASLYYYALSSKILTWIYTSGDAGDWLVQLNWWMTPQCWGKPLYVLMIKGMGLLPFGDDIGKITLLSIVSGAAIVSLTYLIAKNMTGKVKLGLTAALVVLSCNIILSQSTVLEQYTVVGALFLAFFYFYQLEKLWLAAAFLGLTTAVHEIGAVFVVLFIVCEIRRFKSLLKYAPVYIACGGLPYILTIWTMMSPDTPKLLGGFFTLGSINSYGGNTTVTAALAVIETPKRIYEMIVVLFSALGFALIPILLSFHKPWNTKKRVIVVCAMFVLWFYFTNLFPSVWKWLTITLPLMVCLAMVTLDKLPKWHNIVIVIGAIALLITNTVQFNTNTLAHENPLATEYYKDLMALPDGAAIITPRGGAYGFLIFYAMSEGKYLIPLALSKAREDWLAPVNNAGYKDYLWWLNKEFGITGTNIYYLTQDAIDKGHPVYFATPMTKIWGSAFVWEDNENHWLYEVTAPVKYPDFPNTSIESFVDYHWKLRERTKEDGD